jgi:SAM-dependent methyltransferase
MKNNKNLNNGDEYDFYLNEDEHFSQPKFSSLFFLDKVLCMEGNNKLTFLDVGCANGALLSYVQNSMPNWELIGIDIDDTLVQDAKDRNIKATFIVDDFMLPNVMPVNADIVHAAGIINIFKNPKIFIDSLINMSNTNASIFIHGVFNPYEVDVMMNYKDYSRFDTITNSPFKGEWSLFSIRTISDILDVNPRVLKYKFHIIEFPKNMSRDGDPNDLHRSWTIKCDNRVQFTNGLNIVQYQYWLEIILN